MDLVLVALMLAPLIVHTPHVLPDGGILYSMKLWIEDFPLVYTTDPDSKLMQLTSHMGERVIEEQKMVNQAKLDKATIATIEIYKKIDQSIALINSVTDVQHQQLMKVWFAQGLLNYTQSLRSQSNSLSSQVTTVTTALTTGTVGVYNTALITNATTTQSKIDFTNQLINAIQLKALKSGITGLN